MKKEVTIVMDTESIPKNDESRYISLKTRGTLFYGNGLLYISYKENPEEFGKTTTIIKIKKDRLELIRSGNVESRLVFSKDTPYQSSYNTPYGSLPLGLKVSEMRISADQNNGDIFMKYSLDFAGEITENKFTLKYN